MPANASPLEIAWTIINFVGMIRWLQRYVVDWRRRAEIAEDVNVPAPDRVVADIRCLRLLLIVDGLFAYVGVGIITMYLRHGPVTNPNVPGAWPVLILLSFFRAALSVTGQLV